MTRRLTAVSVLLAAALAAAALVHPAGAKGEAAGAKHVLCTFWPEYVFALNVADGVDGVKLDILIPPAGGSPHEYQLSPADLEKAARADLIIANGYLEPFMERLVKAFPKVPVVRTADSVALIPNEGTDEHTARRLRWNPHTWLSVLNAICETDAIRAALTRLYPAGARRFLENAAAYQRRLLDLRGEMLEASFSFRRRKIVTFHNAYAYMARELGLEVTAVIMEVAGKAPSPARVAEIIERIRRSGGAAVFAEPQFPDRVAKLIAEQTGMKTRVLDPGVTTPPTKDAYEKVMRANLRSLSEALGKR